MDSAHKPTATEAKAAKLYKQVVADETTEGALITMYGICADLDGDLDIWERPVLAGAAMLCPTSENADLMTAKSLGVMFGDGAYEVGVDIKPGTYKTAPRVTDCYWERSTRGGDTIANDFVSNAPGGVTVRIRKGDGGFKSDGCGSWLITPLPPQLR